MAKTLSNQSEDKQDENIVDDPNKIIDLSDRNQILKNIELLPNITNKLWSKYINIWSKYINLLHEG